MNTLRYIEDLHANLKGLAGEWLKWKGKISKENSKSNKKIIGSCIKTSEGIIKGMRVIIITCCKFNN